MTTENDILVALSEEHERAREQALAEGDAKAVKWREEGREEGRAKGRAEEAARVAKALLDSGMSAEEIVRITGVPKEAFC